MMDKVKGSSRGGPGVAARRRRFRERLAHGRRPGSRRVARSAVPSFFTLLNLFSGFLAVTQTAEGNFQNACWLIVLAGFFDALDGMMARMTRSQSLFGVELDSLSDIVSFGLAPSFLVYEFGLRDAGPLGLIVSSLPAICGAVRLARFNVRSADVPKDHFEGLPIPVQAAFIVALILNFSDPESFTQFSPGSLSGLIPVVVVLSGLMVSTIRFDALPRPSRGFIRRNRGKTVLFLVALVLLVVFQQIGLLVVLAAYIVHALVRSLRNLFFDYP